MAVVVSQVLTGGRRGACPIAHTVIPASLAIGHGLRVRHLPLLCESVGIGRFGGQSVNILLRRCITHRCEVRWGPVNHSDFVAFTVAGQLIIRSKREGIFRFLIRVPYA